jgi:hypothetical protein
MRWCCASNLFSRIREVARTVTRTVKRAPVETEVKIKFASIKLGADLSGFVPAPQSLLERLGIKKAFVPAGVRPSVRPTIVTPTMLRKAGLEAEEGRALSPAEVKRIHGAKRFTNSYLKQKLRFDPRLADPSLYHPSFWDRDKTFQENWMRDQRRFLRLAAERTGIRYELTESGEWIKDGGARRAAQSDERE